MQPERHRPINAIGVGRGDTLRVYDFGLRRFTLLDPDLRVVRTVPVNADVGAVLAVGRTADGDFVVREAWSSGVSAGPVAAGLRRDSATSFSPLSWTNGLVTGVWRDDLGVERIRVYRIERP